jgi:putative oxidoreductase
VKMAAVVARILLGLIFIVFGLNGFFNFIPQPPMPPGDVLTFFKVLSTSGYMVPIFALQVIGGVLLLAGRLVPLGITLLGPIVFNIFLVHALLAPAGRPLAGFTALLWLLLLWFYRKYFASLFTLNATPS